MKETKKSCWINIIKIAVFLVILLMGIHALTGIFVLKNQPVGPNLNEQTSDYLFNRLDGFYKQEKDSLDVLFFGASQIHCNISPMVMYEEYGFTSYDVSADQQSFALRYPYIVEALKTQSPQVVVVDVSSMLDNETENAASAHYTYDFMKLSPNKVASVTESTDSAEWLRMLFPFFEFHTRWKDLGVTDFTYLADKQESVFGGFFGYTVTNEQIAPNRDVVVENKEISQINLDTLAKLEEVCAEEGIILLLVKLPCAGGQEEVRFVFNQALEAYTQENGLNYIDFTFMAEEIGLDYKTDFTDAAHFNIKGARKMSRYLGEIIYNVLELNEKPEEVLEYWDENLSLYKEVESVALLKMISSGKESDLPEYLNIIESTPELSAIITGKSDSNMILDFEQYHADESGRWNYLAVIDGDEWVKEQTSSEPISELVTVGGREFAVQVDGDNGVSLVTENDVSCMDNLRGLNVIVINNRTAEIVDTRTFDIYHYAYLRMLQ